MEKKTRINHLLDLTVGWHEWVSDELEAKAKELALSEEEEETLMFDDPLRNDLFDLYQYTGAVIWEQVEDDGLVLTEEKLQEFFNTKVIPLILKHSGD